MEIQTYVTKYITAGYRFQHSCNEVTGNADLVRVIVRIVPNADPIYKVYGFDASTGDTSLSANRIDACVYDTTGIVDAIEISVDIDVTSGSHLCGAAVTDMTTYNKVSMLFRVYAYSDTMLSVDDDSWSVNCRSDDLTGATVSSSEAEVSSTSIITLMEPQTDAYLRVRDATTFQPVTVGNVGDRVLISVEYSPVLERGPDNYGTHFFVGFLGNDAISETSNSELYIMILPRYAVRTDITVTGSGYSQTFDVSDGSVIKVPFTSEYMGCSNGGEATVEDIGIEIESYHMEIAVLVCNIEVDTADCYTALPNDVTGTEYYTVSMPSANDASELMVIAQEDGTILDITIPTGVGHSIIYNGATTTDGGTVQVPLNKGQAICLSQTTSNADTSHMAGYHLASNNRVSVFSGNRKYDNDHMVDQIPTVTKISTHYVLIAAKPDDGRATTYIIQAVESGDTVVTRYLSSSTSETFTITSSTIPPLTIDVASDAPCELTSDKPVMVTMVVNNQVVDQGFEHAMVVIPSVQQWAPRYTYHHPDYAVTAAVVRQSASTVVSMETPRTSFNPNLPNEVTVNGPNNYVYSPGISPPAGTTYTLTTEDHSNMMVVCLAAKSIPSNIGIVFLPFGYRYSFDCYPIGHRGDIRDNDCDGLIDEELIDQIDNDGDGYIDEDVIAGSLEAAGAVAIRPTNCRVSGDATYTDTVQVTGTDGCFPSGSSGPFIPDGEFTPQSGDNIGTGTLHKVLYSGVFDLAMFIDKPKLYFICDIAKYCYTADDTDCTTNICQSGTVKRETTDAQQNVTTDVWVFPYQPKSNEQNTVFVMEEATLQTCLDNSYVKVIASFLLIVAVLSFVTSVCFCFMFRKRINTEKSLNRLKHCSHRRTFC